MRAVLSFEGLSKNGFGVKHLLIAHTVPMLD